MLTLFFVLMMMGLTLNIIFGFIALAVKLCVRVLPYVLIYYVGKALISEFTGDHYQD